MSEIKDSKFLLIMADEATSHNNEACVFCIRFTERNNNVREEFIDFIPLIRITEEGIATARKKTFGKLGLDIANITDQGYDGCSSVSSNVAGVQVIINKIPQRRFMSIVQAIV